MHKQAKDKTSTIAKVSTQHSNLADHIKTNIYLLVVKLNKRIMIKKKFESPERIGRCR